MALRHPKPTVQQNAGRLVRRAAQILDDRDWIQGDVGNGERGMCVRGAIVFAAYGSAVKGNFLTHEAEMEFSRWLVAVGQIKGTRSAALADFSSVPGWNDATGRTKEEVVQYMRKFADEVDPRLK